MGGYNETKLRRSAKSKGEKLSRKLKYTLQKGKTSPSRPSFTSNLCFFMCDCGYPRTTHEFLIPK